MKKRRLLIKKWPLQFVGFSIYIVVIKHFRPRSSIIILYSCARARGPSIELNYSTYAPPSSLLTTRTTLAQIERRTNN